MRRRLKLPGQGLDDLRDDLRERNRLCRAPYPTTCIGRVSILPGKRLAIFAPVDPGRVSLDVVLSELLSGFKE
jgi:hypothetical protein